MSPSRLVWVATGLLATVSALAGTVDLPPQIGGPYSVPAKSIRETRFSATMRQQYDFSCGSAALSTLLTHHYGHAVTEQAVFEHMFANGNRAKIQREGFSLLDMKRYLEAHGYQADGFEAPLHKLAEAKLPAIALINENGYNHFVVVKGLRDGRVLIGDPAGGTRALLRPVFDSMWTNGILFVVTNRQQQARFNVASDWAAVPRAPLAEAVQRGGLSGIVMPRNGPQDF